MSARTEQTLECDFCGCYSDKPGKGWTGYRQDGGIAPPWEIVYCPKCAVDELGHSPDIAADHVCVFEAPLAERRETQPQPPPGRERAGALPPC